MPIIQYRQNSSDQSNILKSYASNVTSQGGEDGIIEKAFEIIGEKNYSKWCVEFGAWDGKYLSNTYNLLVNKGWSGVLVEGDSNKFEKLASNYAERSDIYTLNSLVGFRNTDNLDSILSKTTIPKNFGLISIDIDGCDYHVWESLQQYKPTLVLIEYNPTIPNDIVFIQDKDMSINQGSSLLALIELGKQKGYELIAVIGGNSLFVLAEEFSKFKIAENNIHLMRKDSGTRIWQGYDGTIFTNNFTRLGWKRRSIDPEELQVLPKNMRFFGGKPSSNKPQLPSK